MKFEDLIVLYEDEWIMAIEKPGHSLVHHSHYARGIDELSVCQYMEQKLGFKIYPINRLDYKTSGILLLAKSKENVSVYQELFTTNKIEKKYFAIVRGFAPKHAIIDQPISPPKSEKQRMEKDKITYKSALSELTCLETSELEIALAPYSTVRYSLVDLFPKTGRTHQLRKHMNFINHPIIGDHKYGDRKHNQLFEEGFCLTTMFLHAYRLDFECPNLKGRILIKSKPNKDWSKALGILKISEEKLNRINDI